MKKLVIALSLLANTTFGKSDSVSFKNNFTIQGNYSAGNFNIISTGIRTDSKLNNKKSNIELSTIGKITGNKTNPDNSFSLKEKEFYINLSYSHYTKKPKLKFITFSENETSFLRKIWWRTTLGSGYSYKFYDKNNCLLEISEALMTEKIDYVSLPDFYSVRSSTRVKFIYNKTPFSISSISLVQPLLFSDGNVSNLIIRSSTSVDVAISKNVKFGIVDDYILNTLKITNKSPFDNTLNFYIKVNI